EHPGLHAHGGACDRLRAADADPARRRGARLRRAVLARRHGRGRCRLRAANAERAHDRLVRPLTARVRRALPDRRATPRRRPAPDAPRAGEPRRRAVGRRGRLSAGADRPAGRVRGRGPDGGPLRADHRRRRTCGRALVAPPGHGAAARMSTRRLHLDSRGGPGADLLISGAHLFDPRERLDGIADVLVRDGEIAEIGTDLEAPEGAETLDASGLHAFPAFVDPHVHLRTPGREDEEDIETGSRAAAAGGYCQILAMPNTDPVVDSASIIQSLRERARAEARGPTGSTAAFTPG